MNEQSREYPWLQLVESENGADLVKSDEEIGLEEVQRSLQHVWCIYATKACCYERASREISLAGTHGQEQGERTACGARHAVCLL